MGGEKKFGASIGDILKAKQEPEKKPGAVAPSDKPEAGKPEFVNLKLEDLGLSQGATVEDIKKEMEKRGLRLASLADLELSGQIPEGSIDEMEKRWGIPSGDFTEGHTPEDKEKIYSPEQEERFEAIRGLLDDMKTIKDTRELSSGELTMLDQILGEIAETVSEKFGLQENEHYAIFQESLDAKTGLPSLVSREKGRKIIIMDRQAKVKPAPGKRYKVKVVKDTAPGQTHGVMFVELVEAGN